MKLSEFNKSFFDSSGFTLAELAVVVLITGIFLSFTLALPGAGKQKLDLAAAVMAEDIRLTQQLNMNQDGVYTILFDWQNDMYYIRRGVFTYKKVKMPDGVDLVFTNFNDHKLSFKSLGAPQSSGHISLRDKQGKFLYVIVAAVTGRVRVDTVPPA
jgi:prepilin-type N-terminal cleavage/methylation domain-containing protein